MENASNNYTTELTKLNGVNNSNRKLFALRLDHRPYRDMRVSTHIALVARAFGMDGIFFSGVPDTKLMEKINEVNENFGGNFLIKTGCEWKKVVKDWQSRGGEIIHLTMYGLPILEVIEEIVNSSKDKLIVVGGPKVPRELYSIANYNVSITNQPHSEIAALAVFLDYYHNRQEFNFEFKNAKIKIIPSKNGKKFAA